MERKRRDFSDASPDLARSTRRFASCFWCGSIHRAEHPLSVCPACATRFSTMRLLQMSGSYPLTPEAIDAALIRSSPGNYALGYMDGDCFEVFYVGRSDRDVRSRLHEWVDMPSTGERYASTAKAAWAGHRRGPLPLDVPAFGHVMASESSYTRFAYSYAATADAAFAKECRNYDDFGGRGQLDNESRPEAP